MNDNFKNLLNQKRVFKLILGAANQDALEIQNMTAVYAKAGCRFFDVGADKKLIAAVKKGIEIAIPERERENYHICISVGTKNDPHISKCKIDENKCKDCGACNGICPNSAIFQSNSKSQIEEKNCIGCGICKKVCSHGAITKYSINKNLSEILPDIINMGISCLEFHVHLDDEDDFNQKWEQINNLYSGILSISITRGTKSDSSIINFLNFVMRNRKPYTTIIQADGVPMSGSKDNFESNLQALAFADLLQKEQFPAYLFASGGVNTKFTQLANEFEISLTGLSMGTFARNAIKEHCKRNDIFTNQLVLNEAVGIAKNIVNSTLGLKY